MKIIILIILIVFSPALSFSSSLKAGDPLPEFTVVSGKEEFHSSFFKGRVLIITYETKETTEVNQNFKDLILKHYPAERQGSVVSVAVINCSKYFSPIKNICASRTDKASEKLPITVYTDMDGRMFKDFFIKDNDSNIFIGDSDGIVRYAKRGKMKSHEIETALKIIESLVQ